jgi:hypothetical protein
MKGNKMDKKELIIEALRKMTSHAQEILKITPGDLSTSDRTKLDMFRVIQSLFVQNQSTLQKMIDNEEISRVMVQEISGHLEVNKIVEKYIEKIIEYNSDRLEGNQIHFKNMDLFLDAMLPKIWNFNTDLIVIEKCHESLFLRFLQSRNQKRIIIIDKEFYTKGDVIYCNRRCLNNVFESFQLVIPIRMLFLSKLIGSKSSDEIERFYEKISELQREHIVNNNTLDRYSKKWVENTILNIPHISKSKHARGLSDYFKGRDVIIISPGPSLEENLNLLRDKNDKIIIAVAQAVPALTLNGITPEFVHVLDPQDFTYCLDGADVENINIICTEYVSSKFTSMPFKQKFFSFSSKKIFQLSKIFKEENFNFFGAASVSVSALMLAQQLGAARIALIGQDLSFGEKQYYGGYTNKGYIKHSHDLTLPGYYGGLVDTQYDYYIFHKQFQQFAKSKNLQVTLFNCTQGGAFIEGFKHIDLIEFLRLKTEGETKEDSSLYLHQSSLKHEKKLKVMIESCILQSNKLILLIDTWNRKKLLDRQGSEKFNLELEIFEYAMNIDFLSAALHSPLAHFAQACVSGFTHDSLEIHKKISIEEMKNIVLDLKKIFEFCLIEFNHN